jgi:hypothetical protein
MERLTRDEMPHAVIPSRSNATEIFPMTWEVQGKRQGPTAATTTETGAYKCQSKAYKAGNTHQAQTFEAVVLR